MYPDLTARVHYDKSSLKFINFDYMQQTYSADDNFGQKILAGSRLITTKYLSYMINRTTRYCRPNRIKFSDQPTPLIIFSLL